MSITTFFMVDWKSLYFFFHRALHLKGTSPEGAEFIGNVGCFEHQNHIWLRTPSLMQCGTCRHGADLLPHQPPQEMMANHTKYTRKLSHEYKILTSLKANSVSFKSALHLMLKYRKETNDNLHNIWYKCHRTNDAAIPEQNVSTTRRSLSGRFNMPSPGEASPHEIVQLGLRWTHTLSWMGHYTRRTLRSKASMA